MSIWVTGSLEVRDSSDQLVFQVGDSSEGSPAKFSSLEVTGSFEVISDPINANPILTASYGGGDPDIPRVGIGVLDPPGVTLGVKGDLGLSDSNSDTRIAVVGTNAYVNVGQDTNNRGFMFWEGGQKRIRFGTKESGSTFFDSFIIKSGSADVQVNLTVGNSLTASNGLKVGSNSIQASDGGTPISWDTSDNVTIGRSIQINGGSLKASDGNPSITLGTGGNANVVSNLQVLGGEINGSIDGHLYLKADQNLYLDLDDDGDETGRELAVRNNGSSEIFKIAENGDVTTIGDISMANNKSITGVANVIVNYNTNGGTGNFIVERNGVDALLIDSTGKVTISEDLQLNQDRILASDGGVPISWDTNDNVNITGDLEVGGGNIVVNRSSTANTEADIRLRTHDTNLAAGDNIGSVRFWGSENGTDYSEMAYIIAEADEPFVYNTNKGSRLKFGTTRNGSGQTLSPKMELDNAGNLQIDGDIQVSGNEIKGSAGSSAITIDNQDVTIAGMLKVEGNSIQDDAGNEAVTFDGAANTTVEGELTIAGNTINDSGDNASITFDGSGKVTIPKLQMVDTAKVRWAVSVGTTSKQLLDMGDGNGQITFTSGDDITTQYTYCYVAPCAGQFDDFAFLSECSWGSTTMTFGYNSFTLHVYKEARGTSGALSSISPSLTYSFPYNRRTQISLPAVQSAGETRNFQLSGGNIVTFDKGDKLWFAITPLRTTAYYSNNGTASGTQYSHFIAKFTLDTTDF